nr:MAG TPA: hypothetical protein [Bacteriophage sp.]
MVDLGTWCFGLVLSFGYIYDVPILFLMLKHIIYFL